MTRYFTSESVTEGHPDKLCDRISDAILDEFLKGDPKSRVAVETMAMTGQVIIGGEVTSNCWVDVANVARKVIKDTGYSLSDIGFNHECGVLTAINAQSPDIALGVDIGGAGDQGLMFGGAVNESESLMPLAIDMAHYMTKWLTDKRKSGELPWLRPDGKSQVTVPYINGKPDKSSGIWRFVVSTQHAADIDVSEIRHTLRNTLFVDVAETYNLSKKVMDNAVIYINPTGRFVIGGPNGDTGLTGRKIIVDTYGGYFPHGGGAFSGKDPTKVDRSAAYMARHIAKNIVANGLATVCEIQIAYAIGVVEPVGLYVDTKGTSVVLNEHLEKWVREWFDLTPAGIIKYLNLLNTTYYPVAAYGHFGVNASRKSWEQIVQL